MKSRCKQLWPLTALFIVGGFAGCNSESATGTATQNPGTTGARGTNGGSPQGGLTGSFEGGGGSAGTGADGGGAVGVEDASTSDAPEDAPVVCEAGVEKVCNDNCVSISDPSYGCTANGCDACVIANAVTACANAQCVISRCQDGFGNFDGDDTNGCETETPAVIAPDRLRVWLSADHGVTADANGLVSIWEDQAAMVGDGGIAHNATQNTSAEKPTLVGQGWGSNPALPYLDFAGNHEMSIDLSFLSGSDYTIAAVYARATGKANSFLLGTGSISAEASSPANSALSLGYRSDTELLFGHYLNDIVATVPLPQPGADGGPSLDQEVVTAVFAQGGSNPGKFLYLGGTLKKAAPDQVAPLSPAGGDNGAIGRSYVMPGQDTHFVGRLGELVIYTGQLDEVSRGKVENYLKLKWKTNL